jgi:hypothetical protein
MYRWIIAFAITLDLIPPSIYPCRTFYITSVLSFCSLLPILCRLYDRKGHPVGSGITSLRLVTVVRVYEGVQ